MADCGLRRIAALTSIGRIADCTLGTLRCKDASINKVFLDIRIQRSSSIGCVCLREIRPSASAGTCRI
eukprot:15456447-Alexandrium_andersonii.AAC.1